MNQDDETPRQENVAQYDDDGDEDENEDDDDDDCAEDEDSQDEDIIHEELGIDEQDQDVQQPRRRVQSIMPGQPSGPHMVSQDDLSGESRDLIEEQIIDDRQHAVGDEDDIDDYSTQFDLINEQMHNIQANPSYQQHINRR